VRARLLELLVCVVVQDGDSRKKQIDEMKKRLEELKKRGTARWVTSLRPRRARCSTSW
jgi:hypothetical protein